MIEPGSDVVISGKMLYQSGEYLVIELKSGCKVVCEDRDIKSYHPYQPIPETDERKGS